MAKASLIQTNFTSGELSPRIGLGRMDISKYSNGAEALENCIITVQGGAIRRGGTRFIAEVKNSNAARLFPFIYNRSQAYVVEAGDQYMRFYRNRTRLGAPYEIATQYLSTDLQDITYVQKADTCFFAHNDVFPQRLQRFSDTQWAIGNTPFIIPPFAEVGSTPTVTLTLGSAAVGSTSATLSGAYFLAADVGREITSGAGVAIITAVASGTAATVNVTRVFSSTVIAASNWIITESPNTTLTPSAAGAVDAVVNLTLGLAGWRSDDIGKYVSVNEGLVKITSITSATVAVGTVLTEIKTAVAAPASSWILNDNAWNSVRGYPRATTINKQRLYYANSFAYPQTVWASEIRGYLSFKIGVNDDEAFGFELDGATNSPIMHLSPLRKMAVLTESDEMSLEGGQEKPITPTNIQKNDESSAGSNYCRPLKVGNELLFISADGRKVHSLGYRYDIDGFSAPDRTVFADHIAGPGIKEMSTEKRNSTVYGVRIDGVMAVAAYDIEQEVVGWGRWITQGSFESIATIPTATAEDTYVIVSRTIGGVTKRYVEVFDPDVYLDSAILDSSVSAKAVWTGLSHLEGRLVQVRADNVYAGEYTVTGGQITLQKPANTVQIGLGYSALVKLLQPELGGQGTSSQTNQITVREVIVRVLDTQAAVINGVDQEFRQFDTQILDVPPPTISGDVRSTTLSDSVYLTNQTITQPYPAPFHLLNVFRRLTVND